jgi:ABC-type nitrate/sulfonate/bicarbonate transport system permease component
MTTGIRTESEAGGLAPFSGRGDAASWRDQPVLLRLLSIALFAGAWEIAGRIPVSFAFPTFSDTMIAFFGLIADGSMPSAYLSTLQPLVLGVVL